MTFPRHALSQFFAALLVLFAVTAPAQAQTPEMAAAFDAYTLGAGDSLRITVFGEEDLGGEYVVDGSGAVSLPLIGQVRAGGYTVPEFEGIIIEKLSDGYLRTPRVSIEVTNYRPFYIMGEVNAPGQYPYVTGMSVLNAVALAGGYTYRANEDEVVIIRGEPQQEIIAKPGTAILPGDTIRVEHRFF